MRTLNTNKKNSSLLIARDFKEHSNVDITDDMDFLSESLSTDIRENLPPQMLAVVGAVLSVIEDL